MHELSIMENILEIAARHAQASEAAKIHRISLRIGEMSGVSLEALEFAFDVLSKDTMAEGAELVVETVPARCTCEACGTTYEPSDILAGCPSCGGYRSTLLQGRELELVSMEVS